MLFGNKKKSAKSGIGYYTFFTTPDFIVLHFPYPLQSTF